ncbi:MAG: hypothetical protein ACRDC6_07675 [Shewanella sp.]
MSMTDRGLLELAAKAAGLQLCGYSWIGENEDDDEYEILDAAFVKIHPEQKLATKWNPLTDDGDALRLAVKLNLVYGKVLARSVADNHEDGDDIYATTRRAIVLAAAEICKAME